MKKIKFITLSSLFFCSTIITSQNRKSDSFNFIAFGDMPYVLPQDFPRFENVIKAINNENPSFIVNVGDFKASSTPCDEQAYNKIFGYYQQFEKPLIYTPGDNEWTDCSKKEAGAFDPEDRLAIVRKIFFREGKSLGKESIDLTSQSKNPEYSKYIENNRWEHNNVSFATVHIVGSNNNFLSTSKDGNKEFFEREKADLAWLTELFTIAKEKKNNAVVIIIHGDMFSGSKDLKEASGFNEIKRTIKELVTDYKKPVLLINGDSHLLLIDKPLYENEKTKKVVENFTRLQVEGENNMNAVKIIVNPSSPSVFQFEELHVLGN